MNKYKVCVYAISKNERVNVNKWYNSMKEADEIYVLDTGSTDGTVEELKKLGVHVEEKIINPWRFDVARNISLHLVPNDCDICVCTDLDETFEPNWRIELEKIWSTDITRVNYIYNWSFINDKPATIFYLNKIHSRNDYKWSHPVHEVLKNINNNEKQIYTNNIILNHNQIPKNSRSNYLKLLELSVKEDPLDDRNMHYLGREYMYYKKWNKSIDTLIKHLNLKTSIWKDERCASMRYISRCYIALKRYNEAIMWLEKAINESPYLREGYYELGYLLYSLGEYRESKKILLKSLKIKDRSKSYLNEYYCWDGSIEDMISICEFNLGHLKNSINYMKKSLKINPNNERVKNNIKIVKNIIKNNK